MNTHDGGSKAKYFTLVEHPCRKGVAVGIKNEEFGVSQPGYHCRLWAS